MNWKGAAIGGLAGFLIGRGNPTNIIFGAILGNVIERKLARGHGSAARRFGQMFGRDSRRQQQRQQWRQGDFVSCADSWLDEAYSVLGVSPLAGDDDVRRAYRAKAKMFHPDALRARGYTEEAMAKATDMMSKINAAWSAIEKARGL